MGEDKTVKYAKDDQVHIETGNGTKKSSGGTISGSKSIRLFERSGGSLFNQQFDSPILEKFYLECAYALSQRRFIFGMAYLILISVAWMILFPFREFWVGYIAGGAVVIIIAAISIGIAFTPIFKKHYLWISLGLSLVFSFMALLTFAVVPPSGSLVFNLGLVVQLIVMLYAVIPIRLWMCLSLGSVLAILYEILAVVHYGFKNYRFVIASVLLLVAVHIVGFIIHIMSQVRRRTTFLKLCQSARISKDIKVEQQAKSDMIRSLMPDEVAAEVMKECDNMAGPAEDEEPDEEAPMVSVSKAPDTSKDKDDDADSTSQEHVAKTGLVTFRKFHVSQLKDVSVLFADIVGFTRMSSNKTAPHLVYLLNDLFGRFDRLCELTKCEKIATLGDCYYCVSGCPKPVIGHAERCVEMGRSMVKAIQQFDEDHNEEVNMRVGVHTGMVICGIVGTRRFKFDVWSNDVTLANEMESSGEPGKVHISESTFSFVKEIYNVREGEAVPDIRQLKVLVEYFDEKLKCYAIKHTQDASTISTFFIESRKDGKPVLELPRIQIVSVEEAEATSKATGAANETNDMKANLNQPDSPERRESSDSALVEIMRTESSAEKIFYSPPISNFTLNFNDPKLETTYRSLILRAPKKSNLKETLTWATPRLTPLVDLNVNLFFVILVIIACFIGFSFSDNDLAPTNSWIFYVLIGVSILLISLFLIPLIIDIVMWSKAPKGFLVFYRGLFSWYPRNVLGSLIMFLPTVLVLCNFRPCDFVGAQYEYQTITGIMHLFMLCNCLLFTIFSSWTKSATATVAVIFSLALLWSHRVLASDCTIYRYNIFNKTMPPDANITHLLPRLDSWSRGTVNIEQEMTATLLLTLVLIWFLNREYDISFRLSFNCDHQATVEKELISREKRQADWLLENIIPKYIIEDVKKSNKYSRNVKGVGVIFATIANFAEFYDEQFQGGKEMLRVLNEIFADFENLLGNPKYKDVEKIKSIGACFMAASGLNVVERSLNKKEKAHLFGLMDFSVDLLKTIAEFNLQIFNFDFELKIGYNIGDVTAGVIGTTKLLYDIWGDTVNVASRMYSTGSKGRVQVTESVSEQLTERYEFEYRGEVSVKGKGEMKTYLLVKKRDK